MLYRWVSLDSVNSNLLSCLCHNVSSHLHHPGAVSIVNWNMSHVPSLPVLENVFYHVLWISAVSFSCLKLHTLSVGIRGQESGLTSLGNGETLVTINWWPFVKWKYFRFVSGQNRRRMGLVEARLSWILWVWIFK